MVIKKIKARSDYSDDYNDKRYKENRYWAVVQYRSHLNDN